MKSTERCLINDSIICSGIIQNNFRDCAQNVTFSCLISNEYRLCSTNTYNSILIYFHSQLPGETPYLEIILTSHNQIVNWRGPSFRDRPSGLAGIIGAKSGSVDQCARINVLYADFPPETASEFYYKYIFYIININNLKIDSVGITKIVIEDDGLSLSNKRILINHKINKKFNKSDKHYDKYKKYQSNKKRNLCEYY